MKTRDFIYESRTRAILRLLQYCNMEWCEAYYSNEVTEAVRDELLLRLDLSVSFEVEYLISR